MRRLAALALVVLAACTTAAPPRSGGGLSPSAPVAPAGSGGPRASASVEPVAAGAHGQIAYVAGMDPQIYLLDLESGESRQLTDLRPEHGEPGALGPWRPALSCGVGPISLAWAPAGERLAFAYGGCDSVIYVVDLDGTLTRIGDGRGPTWSPDGRFLAYGANVPYCPGPPCAEPSEPGALDLHIVDLGDGRPAAPQPLGGATSQGSMPAFSPDGGWLAFSGPPAVDDGDAATFAATYLVRPDGSDARHVADGAWPAGWLEDGRLVVADEDTSELHALDLEAATSTRLGTSQGPSGVSPDGGLILESISDPATGTGRVRLVDLNGEVLAEAGGWGGAWAPDGSAVAIAQPDASAIVVLGRDGSPVGTYDTALAGGAGELAWRPGS